MKGSINKMKIIGRLTSQGGSESTLILQSDIESGGKLCHSRVYEIPQVYSFPSIPTITIVIASSAEAPGVSWYRYPQISSIFPCFAISQNISLAAQNIYPREAITTLCIQRMKAV